MQLGSTHMGFLQETAAFSLMVSICLYQFCFSPFVICNQKNEHVEMG